MLRADQKKMAQRVTQEESDIVEFTSKLTEEKTEAADMLEKIRLLEY